MAASADGLDSPPLGYHSPIGLGGGNFSATILANGWRPIFVGLIPIAMRRVTLFAQKVCRAAESRRPIASKKVTTD